MENKETLKEKVDTAWQKAAPVFRGIGSGVEAVANFCKLAASYILRMRQAIMSIPVALAALYLAQYTYARLPEEVGINLQTTGEYAYMISREAAVLGPLAVTAVCLLLMFCSRRTVYPWIISIFSLVLPLLILFTNVFPA